MFTRGFAGAAAVVVVAGAGVLIWVGWSQPSDEVQSAALPDAEELDASAKDRLAEQSAMALIADESVSANSGAVQTVAGYSRADAPPGFEPSPLPAHEPTPPAGYAFVSRHEVGRGPMTASDVDRASSPPPPWMLTGEADLLAQAELAAEQGRDWTFGWVKLAEDAGPGELRAALAPDGDVLGQAGDLVRARLPGDAARLRTIAASAAVAGLGTVPPERKVADTLAQRVRAGENAAVPVWITLMDNDPDSRWRRELEAMGAVVGRFDPALRTYAATLPLPVLGPVAAADYVLAVEPIGRLEPALEFSTTSLGADAVRSHDASTGLFAGVAGASVPVGVMDTGLNLSHPDISANRRSICGLNVTEQIREHDQDLWFDRNGHGTGVTAVALGSGAVDPIRAGMAPLVQDIRFAKVVLSNGGTSSALGWGRAMDWFATPSQCGDGVPRKALVINSSVGRSSFIWEGRSVVERKIDATVRQARQLFVTAAGNSSDTAIATMAGAKNALAVGAIRNDGEIADFSSRGPTFDGRLLPNVVAPGYRVVTARGGGRADYVLVAGTSFAAPAVVGVAALVMDAVPGLREEPAALRAHLMASAIKPDSFLEDSDGFRADNTNGPGALQNTFGLGKVSARTAVLSRDTDDGWTGGAAAFDTDRDSYAYQDIVVPPGTSRLDVVLSWDEPAAEAITNTVLHDLDLWLDPHVACGTVAKCGRHASLSRIDNVEWVILRDPAPGLYRVKVLPNRIYGPAPRAGLAWNVIRGDSTPALAVEPDAEHIEVSPGEAFDVSVTVSSESYVAASALLRVDCRAAVGSNVCHDLELVAGESSHATGEDGVARGFGRIDGTEFPLGEIGPGERQTVTLRMKRPQEGGFRLHFSATGWNARPGTASVVVQVGEADSVVPVPTRRPANDDFDAAERLDGVEGETPFDLQFATYESAEPLVRATVISPDFRPRSLWYTWTAPQTSLARFTIARTEPDDYADNVVVAVYEGDVPTALDPVGFPKIGGGVTFFADAGSTYRIQLGVADWGFTGSFPNPDGSGSVLRHRSTPRMALHWAPGHRPPNDDHALAFAITGESGVVEGNNQSATTEPGELMGFTSASTPSVIGPGKSASVWYRWTAPSAGDWQFSTDRNRLVVGVYSGEGVDEMRLVSGLPATRAVFPAEAGQEVRVSVAARHAYVSGADFALTWGPRGRSEPGNDDFAAARTLDVEPSADGTYQLTERISLDMDVLTVEGAEPLATGARTAWFAWQPPDDGRYTARLAPAPPFRSVSTRGAPLQLSAFEGDSLAMLSLEALHDTVRMQPVVAFDATADAPYRFAVGLARSAAETPLGSHDLQFELGRTPSNDDLVNAQPLSGARGFVEGSNRFATVAPGEATGELGSESVWYTYQTEESGWIRVRVGTLTGLRVTVYRRGPDGLELVAVSRGFQLSLPTRATFFAEAGEEYVFRVSTHRFGSDSRGLIGGARPGGFFLSWKPSDAPTRLRYVQAINDRWNYFTFKEGTIDPYALGRVGDMVLNAAGTEYYLASDLGLMVFERDAQTGMLTPFETLQDHPVDTAEHLYWDAAGSALLVASCDRWRKFTPRDGGGLAYAGEIAGAPCPQGRLMIQGAFVHRVVGPWMIETYGFDEDHSSLTFLEELMVDGIKRAAMTADGRNVYAIAVDGADSRLVAIERDEESGRLEITATVSEDDRMRELDLRDMDAMAVHGSHLFLGLGDNDDTMVFDLADRGNPVYLDRLLGFHVYRNFRTDCSIANAWSNAPAVDVFCRNYNTYYVVQLDPDGSLVPGDYSRMLPLYFYQDEFGNVLPWIWAISGVAISPDGRHLYLAGNAGRSIGRFTNELHVFERVYGRGGESDGTLRGVQ